MGNQHGIEAKEEDSSCRLYRQKWDYWLYSEDIRKRFKFFLGNNMIKIRFAF